MATLATIPPNSQADLHILAQSNTQFMTMYRSQKKVNQWKDSDCIDHLEQELQTLSLTLNIQQTSTPTPTEPFGEVLYTNT